MDNRNDGNGNLIEQTGAKGRKIGFTYDDLGRVETMTYPDGEVVTYSYYKQGPVESVTGQGGGATYLQAASYTTLDQPDILTLGNGLTRDYDYDADTFRLETLKLKRPDPAAPTGFSFLQQLAYWYDPVGNVTLVNDSTNSSSWDYDYYPLDRLTLATRYISDDPGSTQVYDYNYDVRNNLTRRTDPLANQDLTLTYPSGTDIRPHGVEKVFPTGSPLQPLAEMTYDANGNRDLDSQRGIDYSYDLENRLTQVNNNGQTVQFVYDGDGQRVKRIDPDGQETIYIGEHFEVRRQDQQVIPIAEGTDDDKMPCLALDTTGAPYIVWRKENDGIYISQPNGVPSKIPGDPATALWPDIAVDANNTIHVVWSEGSGEGYAYGIYYAWKDATGWSNRTKVSQPTMTYPEVVEVPNSLPPSIAVASDGKVHIVWTQYTDPSNWTFNVFHTAYLNGVRVSGPQNISAVLIESLSSDPDINAGPDGSVSVVWWAANRNIGQDIPGAVYHRRWNGSGWEGGIFPVRSSQSWYPTVAVDSLGTAHVAWHEPQVGELGEIKYRSKPIGQVWGDPEQISDGQQKAKKYPALAAGSPEAVYLEWLGTYAHRSSGTWSAPQTIPFTGGIWSYSGQGSCGIAHDPAFGTHLTFMSGEAPNFDIMYAHLDGGDISDITKHYYANGQRIATRVNDALRWRIFIATTSARPAWSPIRAASRSVRSASIRTATSLTTPCPRA